MSDTDFLFSQPSFLSGLASVLDIGGTFTEYNISQTPVEADSRAIKADWQAIGQDLCAAMDEHADQTVNV